MYDYQMFRVVMRGFDRDEVLRYLRTHDEELNQRIAALEKELAVSEKKIRELKERISLKDSQRVELEHEIETKYKRYIENYDTEMIVTSTDIDMIIKEFSDIIAAGINKTLHPGIYS